MILKRINLAKIGRIAIRHVRVIAVGKDRQLTILALQHGPGPGRDVRIDKLAVDHNLNLRRPGRARNVGFAIKAQVGDHVTFDRWPGVSREIGEALLGDTQLGRCTGQHLDQRQIKLEREAIISSRQACNFPAATGPEYP